MQKTLCKNTAPSEQDTKHWQLLLRHRAVARHVGYQGDDEALTDSPLSVTSFLLATPLLTRIDSALDLAWYGLASEMYSLPWPASFEGPHPSFQQYSVSSEFPSTSPVLDPGRCWALPLHPISQSIKRSERDSAPHQRCSDPWRTCPCRGGNSWRMR